MGGEKEVILTEASLALKPPKAADFEAKVRILSRQDP